jgi:AraC-like DNA-binding protein
MSVSVALVRVLLDAVERAGVSPEALLRAQNIDPVRLVGLDGRFEWEEFARLQTCAMDLTGDEALGLHMAYQTPESAMNLVGLLAALSPTMREAYRLCVRFQRLVIDDSQTTLTESGGAAVFRYHFVRTSSERADRMHAEYIVGSLLRMVRTFGGAGVMPHVASFEHARPAHHREYAKLFGNTAQFSQPTTSLTFDRALLDRAHLHQHAELFGILRAEAERALGRIVNGLGVVDQLKRYLLAQRRGSSTPLTAAARDLGVSPRSLRRHLAASGTSYRVLLQETLMDSARAMLRDPAHSIKQTAQALGFADVPAFHRAFKRWTGKTPTEYRGRPGDDPAATD